MSKMATTYKEIFITRLNYLDCSLKTSPKPISRSVFITCNKEEIVKSLRVVCRSALEQPKKIIFYSVLVIPK